MPNSNFQKLDYIFWHDKILAKTLLRLIPDWIYPNHITVFRFIATPFVVILMLYEQYYIGLIAFLLVFSISDNRFRGCQFAYLRNIKLKQ